MDQATIYETLLVMQQDLLDKINLIESSESEVQTTDENVVSTYYEFLLTTEQSIQVQIQTIEDLNQTAPVEEV